MSVDMKMALEVELGALLLRLDVQSYRWHLDLGLGTWDNGRRKAEG